MSTGSFGIMVVETLSPVFLAALTWAAAKLAQLIRAKVQNEHLAGVLLRIDDAVFTAVKDMQKSVVDQLKAASADGKITCEEQKQIKEKAVATARAHLGENGRAAVAKILGMGSAAIEDLLASKVEAAVHDLRHGASAATRAVGPRPPQTSQMAA
jgi:hypothetical protein